MVSQTNEHALESSIEKRLTETSLEELKSEGVSMIAFAERKYLYLSGNEDWIGSGNCFNAIDEVRFVKFINIKLNHGSK